MEKKKEKSRKRGKKRRKKRKFDELRLALAGPAGIQHLRANRHRGDLSNKENAVGSLMPFYCEIIFVLQTFQREREPRLVVQWPTFFHSLTKRQRGTNGRRDRACFKTLEKILKPIEVSASCWTSSSSCVSPAEHKRSHCFSSSRCSAHFSVLFRLPPGKTYAS